jgi:hypothetical protein
LLDYFDRTTGPKQQVWLVHGETARSEILRQAIADRHPSGAVTLGVLGTEVEF